MSQPLTESAIAAFRGQVSGAVYSPTDDDYYQARMAWNLSYDPHPALILMAVNADDIAAGVNFAREHGLDVALQATGHGVVRTSDGALLINTADMHGVTVDPDAQTAWVEAGTRWGDVLAAAQVHGLAPLLGSSPGVGAVAYTLGGGFGWLGRKYGLSADSTLRFEVVTADGEKRTASATENPDLFWGLRGGGGSLAAVTGMEIQLYPVETVYGGSLVYPGVLAGDVFRRWRDWITTVPDEMTTSVRIMNLPDMEFIPPPMRGQTVVMFTGCHCGDLAEGEAMVQEWREWQKPIMDGFRPLPFTQSAEISQDPEDPSPGLASGAWLSDLNDDAVDVLVRFGTLQEGQVPLIMTEVRHAGGAINRVDPDTSAYGHRSSELLLSLIGMVPAPPVKAALADYYRRMLAALGPSAAGTVYMNFLEGDEAANRVRDGFTPEKFGRLVALKAKYDPDNLFSRSMAIPVSD
ncbi:MAG: FAD-binding oxidoreductase [Chloroflexota bacterium]